MTRQVFVSIITSILLVTLSLIFFYPRLLSLAGDQFLKLNNYKKAIEHYEKAIKNGYSNSRLYTNLGFSLFSLSRIKELKKRNNILKKPMS